MEDFLFTYYSHRPAKLRRWHPGAGIALAGPGSQEWLEEAGYARREVSGEPVAALDVDAFRQRRGEAVRFVQQLLTATAERPPQLGCLGLHEWAMVYRLPADRVRHAAWPLRLGTAGTDAVVESHRLRCTHHDAFRFFTPQARPRNAAQPQREDQVAMEQPGCVHATMDLYKWAYKLGPAVPGELVLDCFVLARDARELDMRASPYDLSGIGYSPVAIETAEGRAAYVEEQRALAFRGAALRARLLAVCERILPAAAVGA